MSVGDNKNLLILAEGVNGQIAKDVALSMNCFDKVDVLDSKYGTSEYDSEFHADAIGNVSDYASFSGNYKYAIALFDDSQKRVAWTKKLEEELFRVIPIISPKAAISDAASIGKGSLIEPFVQVGPNTVVGDCCFIKSGTIVSHSSMVGIGSTLENNCLINSGAVVDAYKT